ncbi:MAG: FmdE family protein [Candidatus Krumholzibacteria bacterium]|nr:FmdE family protein [Candidatus Krumholzibacteria bacterium]
MKLFAAAAASIFALCLIVPACCSGAGGDQFPWNARYDFIRGVPSITFHNCHGVMAGSYPDGRETVEIGFDDACGYLGHVCICTAGGYRIAQIAVDTLQAGGAPLEKGEFVLIASRDNAVSDVVAFVLGSPRRNDPEKNQHFIDESIETAKREYVYYVAYRPLKRAVRVIYRKHLLVGNEMMDRLWKIETAAEEDPASVSESDMTLYRGAMADMVRDVLLGNRPGLFEAAAIDYDEFLAHLGRMKSEVR